MEIKTQVDIYDIFKAALFLLCVYWLILVILGKDTTGFDDPPSGAGYI